MRALKLLVVVAVLMVSASVCEAWPRVVAYPGYAYGGYYAPSYYGAYYAPAPVYSTWRYPAYSTYYAPYSAYYGGGYVAPAPYATYYRAPGYYYGW
jgi:hypothetical protein